MPATEKIMFLPGFICLLVCLSVSRINQNVIDDIFERDGPWYRK